MLVTEYLRFAQNVMEFRKEWCVDFIKFGTHTTAIHPCIAVECLILHIEIKHIVGFDVFDHVLSAVSVVKEDTVQFFSL